MKIDVTVLPPVFSTLKCGEPSASFLRNVILIASHGPFVGRLAAGAALGATAGLVDAAALALLEAAPPEPPLSQPATAKRVRVASMIVVEGRFIAVSLGPRSYRNRHGV